jgi:Uma2 family endonuclease
MTTDQALRLSPDEYLAFERNSQTKHEYVDGELREMTGASRDHVLIGGNIHGLLWSALRGRKFEVYDNDMRVRIPDGPYYYPDVVVAPSPPQLEDDAADTLLNPLVLVEVLSPSTEEFDRGGKHDDYRLIPSLTDYLTVAQDRVWVDHHRRSAKGWRLRVYKTLTDRVAFPDLGCDLSLTDIYERVFPAQ